MITKKFIILVSITLFLLFLSGCGGDLKPTKKYTLVEKVKKNIEKDFAKKINNLGVSIITFNKPLQRDNVREVVYDPNRQALWQDNKAVTTVYRDWEGAKAYCENLTFAGSSGWRLPTIEELLSITDDTKYNPAIKDGFKYVDSGNYWSSSSLISYSSLAWYVNFKYGSDDDYEFGSYAVRCIQDSKTLKL